MDENAAQAIQRRLAGKTRHLDVLKPMVRKPRMPRFAAGPFQNVRIGLKLLVRIELEDMLLNLLAVNHAIGSQSLAILHHHFAAGGAAYAQFREPGEVLAQVEDKYTRLGFGEA